MKNVAAFNFSPHFNLLHRWVRAARSAKIHACSGCGGGCKFAYWYVQDVCAIFFLFLSFTCIYLKMMKYFWDMSLYCKGGQGVIAGHQDVWHRRRSHFGNWLRYRSLLWLVCTLSRALSLVLSFFLSTPFLFYLARSPARSVSLLLDCLIYVRMPFSLFGARARSVSFRVDSFIYMRICLYLCILS